ncbi:MAG: Dephospho-CoA kinase [Cyanobacteriota bacterium]
MQRRIGLTGGIATGKSSAGRLLAREHQLPVLDADSYARTALARGSAASRAVLARYGAAVQTPTDAQELDRRALGAIVFNDPEQRRWLEQLIHPLVRQRFDQELQRLDAAPTVVLMVPLLFEGGLEALCSETWLVDCDEDQQLQRLISRDQCTPAQALARIQAQWPLAHKRSLANRVINNRGGPGQLAEQINAALGKQIQ